MICDTLEERLRAHVAALEGDRCPWSAPRAHARARDYVARELGAPLRRHAFQADSHTFENLIVERGDGRVLVGAHFDSVPGSPGADDNASGVAALLELARAGRDGLYVAFDLEESGMVGSAALARDLKRERRRLDVMLSLEMLGYRSREPGSQSYPPLVGWGRPGAGDFIGLIANGRARRAMKRLAAAIARAGVPVQTLVAPLGGWLVPATRLSDHSPFWDAGYPAIMVTDTAWLRNPNYHDATDRKETLDYAFLTAITRGILDFVMEQANHE